MSKQLDNKYRCKCALINCGVYVTVHYCHSAASCHFVHKAIISLFLISSHHPHQFLGCLTKF